MAKKGIGNEMQLSRMWGETDPLGGHRGGIGTIWKETDSQSIGREIGYPL